MYEAGYITHLGKLRRLNEDSFLVRTDTGMWAVADGMGGHDAGDLASRIVVKALDAVERTESAAELLQRCKAQVTLANEQIGALSKARSGATVGTTVAILLIREAHYACMWAGDSRIYLANGRAIQQLSLDHTEVEELVSSGTLSRDEAKSWPSNIITRAVGVSPEAELDVVTGPVEPGDIFVICSDGLTRHVRDEEIHQAVISLSAQDACEAMLELALLRGGLDNVTAIVVRPQKAARARSEATLSPLVPPRHGGSS
jgi:protein phosphatase